jgi:hypothetical protein
MSYTAINQYARDPSVLTRWGAVAHRIRSATA